MDRGLEKEEKFLTCPLTLEVMDDPVIAFDGFTYERKAIENWLERNMTSPMTNIPIQSKTLIPNFAIKSQIISYRERIEKENELKELEALKVKKRAFKLYFELNESQKQIVEKGYSEQKKNGSCTFKTPQREWDCMSDKAKRDFLSKTQINSESSELLTITFVSFLSFTTQIMRHNLKDRKGVHPSTKSFWNESPALQVDWIEKFLLEN